MSGCQCGSQGGTVTRSLAPARPNKCTVLQKSMQKGIPKRRAKSGANVSVSSQEKPTTAPPTSRPVIKRTASSTQEFSVRTIHAFIRACPHFSDTTHALCSCVHLLRERKKLDPNRENNMHSFSGEKRPERANERGWSRRRYLA